MRVENLREQNLTKAISGYKRALKVFKKEETRLEYSRTTVLMGNSYLTLAGVRDKETNTKSAIQAYKEALTILTKDSYPEFHKVITHNLAELQKHLTKK